jgi:tRNA pseudouridine38-40 synthase
LARYKAVIEYDGTDFIGFQRQAPDRGQTIQGELEAALARINRGEAVTVLGAGRTDTGVHASGQVIAFNLEWRHGSETLERALNAHLPRTIAARLVVECDQNFHPRYSAKGRRYRYSLYQSAVRSPLRGRYAWQVMPGLQIEAMQRASEFLLGRKDFAAFGSAPEEDGHTVREITEARWEILDGGAGLNFYIAADAFLFRMVRSIVGTLKKVGTGEISPVEFSKIVTSADRSQGANIAPPNGLCLIEVLY